MSFAARRIVLRAVASAALAFSLVDNIAAAELLLADGTKAEAKLAVSATDQSLTFDAGGKRIAPKNGELIRFGAFVSPGKEMLVVLEGDDVVTFTEAALDGDELQLKTNQLGELTVPIASAHGLLFQPPVESLARDRLIDDLAAWTPNGQDANARITLDNADTVTGKLKALTAAELTIDSAAGSVALPIDRVRAIAIRPSNPKSATHDSTPRGLRFVVGTSDGSRVTATEIKHVEAGLQLKLIGGASLTIERANIVALQTLGGRATYLSDTKATGYKHVPYLTTTWPLTTNRHVAGGRLRATGREFLKGLGMHSAASAVFSFDKPYRRFEADLAIDDSVFTDGAEKVRAQRPPRGSVIFRIYIDAGDGKWQLRHTSEIIRGGDKPTPVSVDVSKAKRLSLIVDFADRADEWDRADWLDARFID